MTDLLRRRMLMLLGGLVAPAFLPSLPALADDDGEGGGGDDGDSDGGDSDGEGSDGHDGGDGHDGDAGGDDDGPDDDEQERARAGRVSGALLPLSTVLAKVRKRYPGTVLNVRLGRDRGRAYYVIRILTRQDRVLTVRVSAEAKRRGNWTSRRRMSR